MYNLQDAIKDLLNLLRHARAAGDTLWEVKALVDLSRMYFLIDPAICLRYVDDALERSQTLNSDREKALVRGYHAH